MLGMIRSFNNEKLYGFILAEDGRDMFFHSKESPPTKTNPLKKFTSGDFVEFVAGSSQQSGKRTLVARFVKMKDDPFYEGEELIGTISKIDKVGVYLRCEHGTMFGFLDGVLEPLEIGDEVEFSTQILKMNVTAFNIRLPDSNVEIPNQSQHYQYIDRVNIITASTTISKRYL